MSSENELPPHFLKPEKHLKRAQGYFALDMFEEARRELRALPKGGVWNKRGRELLVAIHSEQEQWGRMMEVARGLRHEFPEEAEWWVMDAFATRREESIEEAREILLKGLALHYDDALIRYNLGCYACVLKSFGECIDFLKEAVRRDEKFKLMALQDEDLSEVREALLKMGWDQVVV
ncbi:MAG: hypothetical protein VXX29_10135 [Verrucomicrobiota bacterium]|nr:hypothetical protein [Verrucomicrobiota bacterium]